MLARRPHPFFVVVDAFNQPVPGSLSSTTRHARKLLSGRKRGRPPAGKRRVLHGSVNDRLRLSRQRFKTVKARVLRNKQFMNTNTAFGSTTAPTGRVIPLSPVESLMGTGTGKTVHILGVLVRDTDGRWQLEDLTGSVLVDLSNCAFKPGFFTSHHIVLCAGTSALGGKLFKVDTMCMPPAESREDTLEAEPENALTPNVFLDTIAKVDEETQRLRRVHRERDGGQTRLTQDDPSSSDHGDGTDGTSSSSDSAEALKGEQKSPSGVKSRVSSWKAARRARHKSGLSAHEDSRITPNIRRELHAFGDGVRLAEDLAEQRESRSLEWLVVLSDCYLDDSATIGRLRKLFRGYSKMPVPPPVFVLCGNFTRRPVGVFSTQDRLRYCRLFNELGTLLQENPRILAYSQFVIVPGPWDLSATGRSLPQSPLSAMLQHALTHELDSKGRPTRQRRFAPHVTFASNPCRMIFWDQEIVLFRHNLSQVLKERSIVGLDRTDVIYEHSIATVCHQGTLVPLSVSERPVAWQLSHSLALSPLPDVLMVCETGQKPAHGEFKDMLYCNPGSFGLDGTFAVYNASKGKFMASAVQ